MSPHFKGSLAVVTICLLAWVAVCAWTIVGFIKRVFN